MKKYNIPFFGKLDADNLDSNYSASAEIQGEIIQIELNFQQKEIAGSVLENVLLFLNDLSITINAHKQYFRKAITISSDESVVLYAEHHLEELEKGTLQEIIGNQTTNTDLKLELIKCLKPVRIALDIGTTDKDTNAIFDYSIDPNETQYVLACSTDLNGKIDSIEMES